jgi:hypothetical protein
VIQSKDDGSANNPGNYFMSSTIMLIHWMTIEIRTNGPKAQIFQSLNIAKESITN